MGRKRTPGLFKRGGIWHIDKQTRGGRIRESTGTCLLEEAERYLARQLEEQRQAAVYGVRPKRTFREAAIKYLMENQHKASAVDDKRVAKELDPFIGKLYLEAVHMGSLQPYIQARKKDGVKNRTINYGLQVTRRILNVAASEWMDENGLTWLATAPKIKLLPQHDERRPYPLSWEEQHKLFAKLPAHLERMALFAVNTGCRTRVVCGLRWEWEFHIPELSRSVFVVPKEFVKNHQDRLVILNDVTQSIIDEVREQHPEFVFLYQGRPIKGMGNTAWQNARKKVGLPQARVHDLKHTFGRRLRAIGVSFEDRQDLLGHKSKRITTHYSSAEIQNLIDAANKVNDVQTTPKLTLLKVVKSNPHKIPTMEVVGVKQKQVTC